MTPYLHLVVRCGITSTCQPVLSWHNASLNSRDNTASYLQDGLMCWFISHTSQWWRFDTGVVTSCVTVLVFQCIHSYHNYVTSQRPSFDPRPVCGICDRQGGHGIGFSPCTFVLPRQCYSTNVPHSHPSHWHYTGVLVSP